MMFYVRFLMVFFALLFVADALAWPPTYGPEFTFSNGKINGSSERARSAMYRVRWKFLEAMRSRCETSRSCVVNGTVVEFSDGWWFKISTDPRVIEIQAKPMVLEEVKKLSGRIQNEIFDVAASIGLHPTGHANGMGHIHIGIESAFGNDALAFRNFVVDLVNHPELSEGILGRPDVDVTLAEAQKKARLAFADIVESFDRGEIRTISDFADKIKTRVYSVASRRVGIFHFGGTKFQVINLDKTVGDVGTIEFRGIRAQANSQEFLQLLKLFEARIGMLKSRGKPIRLWSPNSLKTPKAKVSRFYQYVTEAGLDWNEYKNLVPERWRSISPDLRHPAGVADIGRDTATVTRLENIGSCVVGALRTLIGLP